MFCYKCGKQLPDDAQFCSACGTTVQDASVQSVTPPEPTVEPVEIKPEKVKKEKKPMDAQKKKTLLMILGALALLAAVIGGICLYLQNHDVADIPDPEYYFGDYGEVEIEDYGYAVSYLIRSETDLADATRAYYELLTSAYPFELKNEKIDDDGDITYELRYDGDGYIWNRSIYQEIDIDYFGNDYSSSDDRYVSGVWISRPKNFNIEEREQYDGSVSGAPAAGETAQEFEPIFTDAALYFAEKNGEPAVIERRGVSEEDTYSYIQDYFTEATNGASTAAVLEEYFDQCLTAEGQFVELGRETLMDGDKPCGYYWFKYQGDAIESFGVQDNDLNFRIGNCDLMYCYWEIYPSKMGVSCWYSKDLAMRESDLLTIVSDEPEPEPAPEPEPEPQPTQQPTQQQPTQQQPASKPSSSDPSVLPDFLAHDASGKFEQVKAAWADMAVFAADDSSLRYVAENYVQILKDMGYTVVDTEEKQKETFDVYRWYMANSAVNAETIEGNAQIYVKIMYYKDKQHSEITVAYGDGITYGGDVMTGSSGSNDFWDTCSACGGDGKCNICNGSDTVSRFQAGIGWVDQNCTSCSGGRCPFCGGTGKP